MSVDTRTEVVRTLEKVTGELQGLARTAESEIGSVARAFECLADHVDTILKLVAAIVGCVENDRVSSVLPKVQALGAAARRFIEDRLQATAVILETVTTEMRLLRQLSLVTGGQAEIALQTRELSILTNIEVARLGSAGVRFQYLAR